MAKKRVYEIAKERGVSSKELLEALRAAGVDVKAAASTVDETDALKVLTADGAATDGKTKTAAGKSAPAPKPAEPAPTPPEAKTPSPADRPPQRPEAPRQPQGPRDGGGPPRRGISAREGAPGTSGRRRRVVIDSQASRRQAPAPMPQQRRRRSRGRGAPPPEPSESGPSTAVVERPAIKIPSGATVRDVAEHFGVRSRRSSRT